jgi:aminotransferase in exopolysaccharide biosynthesis
MAEHLVKFVRDYFNTKEVVPLHAPLFIGNEHDYVAEAIKSSFVSSVGAYVTRFEEEIAEYVGAEKAVAVVNGTSALHASLLLAGVGNGDVVITQPLTFVATCNAIAYCGAQPLFIDVDCHTLGLSPIAMAEWLDEFAFLDDDGCCRIRADNRVIRACVPMHTFGHPADIDVLVLVAKKWNIALIEDAAESLGSFYKGRHTGTFGSFGAISFNGNKILTTGGGGVILASEINAKRAKHLTTTAKKDHPYEYIHDEVGYNYRMPNLNAAMGCAQLEQLEGFVAAKRQLASLYEAALNGSDLLFFKEPEGCRSNYWLNTVICENKDCRDKLLQATNAKSVMTRPVWTLMNNLKMYENCSRGNLSNAEWLGARLVNLPSSVVST